VNFAPLRTVFLLIIRPAIQCLCLGIALACGLATAAPLTREDQAITISFDKISVLQLAAFVYGDMLKVNFAIHNDLVDSPKVVSVHFQSAFDRSKLAAFIVETLASAGVVVEQKPGYVLLRPVTLDKPEVAPLEVFYYRPKYRAVAYLTDVTASLFKTGRFTSQRIVRAPTAISTPAPTGGALLTSPATTGTRPPPPDTGTSAQSTIDRSEQDAFLFEGTEKEIAQLQRLLVQLDTPVAEVFVKGMVYEVTTSARDGSAFALAVSLLKGRFNVSFGQVLAGGSASIKNGTIDAVFSALANDTRFKSVSHPSLRVRSGGAARFSVGADVPVLGTVQLDKNGNPVQSVEYKPSGSIFDIRPQIRDASIDLSISQQLSNFVVTTTGVNNSPTLIKREISTNISTTDGDVIVLGGLDENRTSADTNGFSFLPSWTRSKGSDSSSTQILLVLQVERVR